MVRVSVCLQTILDNTLFSRSSASVGCREEEAHLVQVLDTLTLTFLRHATLGASKIKLWPECNV